MGLGCARLLMKDISVRGEEKTKGRGRGRSC
jgi:hypothetical protein